MGGGHGRGGKAAVSRVNAQPHARPGAGERRARQEHAHKHTRTIADTTLAGAPRAGEPDSPIAGAHEPRAGEPGLGRGPAQARTPPSLRSRAAAAAGRTASHRRLSSRGRPRASRHTAHACPLRPAAHRHAPREEAEVRRGSEEAAAGLSGAAACTRRPAGRGVQRNSGSKAGALAPEQASSEQAGGSSKYSCGG